MLKQLSVTVSEKVVFYWLVFQNLIFFFLSPSSIYSINLFHGNISNPVIYVKQKEMIAYAVCYPKLIFLWQSNTDLLQENNTS